MAGLLNPFRVALRTWRRVKDYHPISRWTLTTLVWLPLGITFTELFYTVKSVSGKSMKVRRCVDSGLLCKLTTSPSQPTLNPDSSLSRDVVICDRFSLIYGDLRRGDIVTLK